MKNLISSVASIIVCALISSGCASDKGDGAAKGSFPKWQRDPYYWYVFRDSVGRSIKQEVAGEKPTAGAKDWNDYWQGWIKGIRDHYEGEKKAGYIIQRRREARLPELSDR